MTRRCSTGPFILVVSPVGRPWRCYRDRPPERRQRIPRDTWITCALCVHVERKRDKLSVIWIFMRVLSTRVFLSQGSNGLPGPIGPPGHRGYHGPKVSYSDRGGLFMTSQELWHHTEAPPPASTTRGSHVHYSYYSYDLVEQQCVSDLLLCVWHNDDFFVIYVNMKCLSLTVCMFYNVIINTHNFTLYSNEFRLTCGLHPQSQDLFKGL